MSVINITTENYQSEVAESSKTVLLDFWASWCGPCSMLTPIVHEFAEENPDVKVCKINVDEAGDLSAKFRIANIPTLVVVKNGEEVKRSIGVISKSAIEELVK
ncbi:MAG: thioredoxin [Lachnospiraceae bacterium]|nr:thioredoxin [Lachnospiraceae bacterium]